MLEAMKSEKCFLNCISVLIDTENTAILSFIRHDIPKNKLLKSKMAVYRIVKLKSTPISIYRAIESRKLRISGRLFLTRLPSEGILSVLSDGWPGFVSVKGPVFVLF